jgi:hypothetical protein
LVKQVDYVAAEFLELAAAYELEPYELLVILHAAVGALERTLFPTDVKAILQARLEAQAVYQAPVFNREN